ncbi:MAG TPA: T9SS type A sorting domain-containing protein [Candidatus Kryptonia bacterium]
MNLKFRGLIILFSLMYTIPAFSQSIGAVIQKDPGGRAVYPIAGSHLLWKQEEQVREYLKTHPDEMRTMRLQKTGSWGFTVGSTHNWYAHNFVLNNEYTVNSTCRAVGVHCYIFVEDSLWSNGRVTQVAVDSVKNNFDNRTPANASKGIYRTDVETFGNPPDVDNDSLIIILILNIIDGWNGTGGYVAGYFSSLNEVSQANSNKAEIYYLDADPAVLTSAPGIQDAMSTTAHEFQHMIHWNYDPNEITFVNEGCSTLAEVNCGFPIYEQSYFVGETNHYLFDWRTTDNVKVLNDYSRSARFMTYIRDQIGIGVFKDIVASTLHGIDGLNAGFAAFGSSLTFDTIFRNWTIANILDDRSVDPAYGYLYPDLPKGEGPTYLNPNASGSSVISHLGSEYLIYRGGSNLSISFTTGNSAIVIKAIEKGSGTPVVADVTPGVQFTVPEFGSTYSEVDFAITNTDHSNDYSVSYTSAGTVVPTEFKWDTTEPIGYLTSYSQSDTVCVTFDGANGAVLDSVRIALRRAGSITGGVWEYTDVVRPSPLGKKLSPAFAATIGTTTTVPYPVPYQNWATVNLTSDTISIENPFVVGFIIGSDPSTPGVMITEYPSASAYHSFTYLGGASSGANWYYLNASTDTLYLYLIRAYASFLTPVREPVELTPKQFEVSQNYPNPFNPATVIQYRLPQNSFVSVKVFDLLGREMKTLVNERETAGEHSVSFDASGLASGVYVYVVRAGTSVQSRKMLVLK